MAGLMGVFAASFDAVISNLKKRKVVSSNEHKLHFNIQKKDVKSVLEKNCLGIHPKCYPLPDFIDCRLMALFNF